MSRLVVAGGGTGGHVFPGVAVAEEFLGRDREAKVLFIGTGRPVEVEVLSKRDLKSRRIMAMGFKGQGWYGRLKALAAVPVGIGQSLGIYWSFKPDLALGVGGYVSGPALAAARIMGLPTAIHEQNSIPGMTNKNLARLVDLIFISFESSRKYFPQAKTHLTGNPIRREITQAAYPRPGDKNGPTTVLVVGGSQGAHAVNMTMLEALRLRQGKMAGLSVMHQTGTNDFEMIRDAYAKLELEARAFPFIDDMAAAYQTADLVVCRAGALTVAEVAVTGRPAVFVPLPTAADNHQELNARSLVEAGAAEMILQKDLTPELLADTILRLAGDKARLNEMSQAARKAALPDAAARICDLLAAHLEKKMGRRSG
ncbi:MAG: undecaprenyldiphospho-muramoylpentapeptide beta-N-acetylglucosaminyltransferase [Pseudomonadota bacterium]